MQAVTAILFFCKGARWLGVTSQKMLGGGVILLSRGTGILFTTAPSDGYRRLGRLVAPSHNLKTGFVTKSLLLVPCESRVHHHNMDRLQ